MNYASLFQTYQKQLEELGEDPENVTYVFRELKNWSLLDFIKHQNKDVSLEDQNLLVSIMSQLKSLKSPQYITGKAYFRDVVLDVDERVLIPRPETEELVEKILEENPTDDINVIDIGTGSGAIAIALKKARPNWQVTASDISKDALAVASKNADTYNLEIKMLESNLFSSIKGKFDIIVSNPPYISYDDKDEVGQNVLASEPHLALFADNEGYAIYEQIINAAQPFLKDHGKIYFEIGYKQGQRVRAMLEKYFPDKRVRVLKDFYGKDRMVILDDK